MSILNNKIKYLLSELIKSILKKKPKNLTEHIITWFTDKG